MSKIVSVYGNNSNLDSLLYSFANEIKYSKYPLSMYFGTKYGAFIYLNLENLVDLNLDGNKLSGKLPDVFGRITKLQTLYLGNNHLEGPIPESLGRCMQLERVHCEQNRLSGSIPDSIFRLPLLQSATFAGNLIISESPSTDNASSDD
ncbi:hypothetical protein HDU80_002301, partial [Chytriomyces hyalinus]